MITCPTSRGVVNTSAAQRVSMQLSAGLHDSRGAKPRAGQRVRPRLSTRGLGLAAWETSSTLEAPTPTPAAPAPPQVPADPRAAETGSEAPPACAGGREGGRGTPATGRRAHWQHSATCLKSSSPCSSLKHRRQWGHCRSPWPLRVTPEHPPSAGRSSHWGPVPGLRPPAATGSEASVSKYLGDLLPV